MSGDCLLGELERVIKIKKSNENLAPENDIVFSLPKIPRILDSEDFEQKQEIKKNRIMK